ICCMRIGNFSFLLSKFLFGYNRFFTLFPISSRVTCFVYNNTFAYFVRFNKTKGELGEYIVNFRPTTSAFYIHLLAIYSITISPALWRNYWFKMRISIAFITG